MLHTMLPACSNTCAYVGLHLPRPQRLSPLAILDFLFPSLAQETPLHFLALSYLEQVLQKSVHNGSPRTTITNEARIEQPP